VCLNIKYEHNHVLQKDRWDIRFCGLDLSSAHTGVMFALGRDVNWKSIGASVERSELKRPAMVLVSAMTGKSTQNVAQASREVPTSDGAEQRRQRHEEQLEDCHARLGRQRACWAVVTIDTVTASNAFCHGV